VRLVEQAQSRKAPFVRLADRYALAFVPLTLLIAAAAWLVSGDPVRALAVLVVATPCPLILAAPVAIVSGMSRAAHRGVIVKDGGALEALARARVLLLDKTGTLTAGAPRLRDVETFDRLEPNDLLRLTASLDQASPHPLASAIVAAARQHGLGLSLPTSVEERHGAGIRSTVDGRAVALGNAEWAAGRELPPAARALRRRGALDSASCVFVAVDGRLSGALVLEDPLRPDAARVLQELRRAGIERIVMVSGDHAEVTESIGVAVGVDRVLSERDPADKVDAVREARREGLTIMVGDGVNDAPALALADVGVAMGARGATASSEAADVVLTVDRLDRLAEAMRIARRSRAIALQSVLAGMSLSLVAMLVAAGGWLVPVVGAVIQEAIDVAVILNALRALGDRWRARAKPPPPLAETAARLRQEHSDLTPWLDSIRRVADRLEANGPPSQVHDLEELAAFLEARLRAGQLDDPTPLVLADASGHARAGQVGQPVDAVGLVEAVQPLVHGLGVAAEPLGELGDAGPVPACGDDAGALDQAGGGVAGAASLRRVCSSAGSVAGRAYSGGLAMWSPSSARRRHDEHKADRQTIPRLRNVAVGSLAVADVAGLRSAGSAAAVRRIYVKGSRTSRDLRGCVHHPDGRVRGVGRDR
jgi:heavy metal translocating P-type ATPase